MQKVKQKEIKDFKQALIKGEVIFILTRVSKSGLERSFKVLYYHKNSFHPIPFQVANISGDDIDKNSDIKIRGIGMDMSFALFKNICNRFFKMDTIGKNYKTYISYEEFLRCNTHMQKIIKISA